MAGSVPVVEPELRQRGSVAELVRLGLLHPECEEIFRVGKGDGERGQVVDLHQHQREAVEVARGGAAYVRESRPTRRAWDERQADQDRPGASARGDGRTLGCRPARSRGAALPLPAPAAVDRPTAPAPGTRRRRLLRARGTGPAPPRRTGHRHPPGSAASRQPVVRHRRRCRPRRVDRRTTPTRLPYGPAPRQRRPAAAHSRRQRHRPGVRRGRTPPRSRLRTAGLGPRSRPPAERRNPSRRPADRRCRPALRR